MVRRAFGSACFQMWVEPNSERNDAVARLGAKRGSFGNPAGRVPELCSEHARVAGPTV